MTALYHYSSFPKLVTKTKLGYNTSHKNRTKYIIRNFKIVVQDRRNINEPWNILKDKEAQWYSKLISYFGKFSETNTEGFDFIVRRRCGYFHQLFRKRFRCEVWNTVIFFRSVYQLFDILANVHFYNSKKLFYYSKNWSVVQVCYLVWRYMK